MSISDNSDDLMECAADFDSDEAFVVDVDGFEGPLHLLLALARKQKVDLKHVSVLELATQYLAFIEDAHSKRIDLAADYLLMAAWLAYLKSKLLLPTHAVEEDTQLDSESMAERLAFRLKRLEAMRDGAQMLNQRALTGRDVFLRGAPEQSVIQRRTEYHARLIDMMAAFADIQKRKARLQPHRIEKQLVLPLEVARDSLKKAALDLDDWQSIDDLPLDLTGDDADAPPRSRLASVFLAALELTRERNTDIRQDHHFRPVYVRRAKRLTAKRSTVVSNSNTVINLADDAPEDIRAAVEQLRFGFNTATSRSAQPTMGTACEVADPRTDGESQIERLLEAERRVEAILFASRVPLSADALIDVLPEGIELPTILMRLQRTYAARGVHLVEVDGRWRFQTAEDLGFLFVEHREEQRKMSQAALETLAIIAYCQPVTRAEIEDVRGVAVSKGTLDVLMEAGWIKLRGRRRTPGRPVTYGTSSAFLEHFGLESLDVLPGKSEFEASGLLDSVIPSNFEMPSPVEGAEDLEALDADALDAVETSFHVDFMDAQR